MPRRLPPGPVIQRPIPGGGGEFNGIKNRFFSDGFRRLFGLAEGVAVESVAPEVMPVQSLDERHLLALGGAFPWATANLNKGPTVGNFSEVGCRNPVGSNLIVIVDFFCIEHVAAAQYQLFIRSPLAAAAALQGSGYLDGRFTVRRAPPQQMSLDEVAVNGLGPLHGFTSAVAEVQWWPVGVILPPGTETFFVRTAQNLATTGYCIGRAWRALPEELSLGGS